MSNQLIYHLKHPFTYEIPKARTTPEKRQFQSGRKLLRSVFPFCLEFLPLVF